jgi:hypothetical protein
MMKHKIIKPPNMDFPLVEAFFTTKTGGDAEKLLNAGIPSGQKVYLPIQKHTDRVVILEADMKPAVADAVITNRKDILVGVQAADCVPMVVFDRRNMVIGAVHAGWRGTAAQILKKTIRAMSENFHSSADDMFIAIGPSIRGCCYHVGADVHKAICASAGDGDCSSEKESGFFVDLASANMLQAVSLGVMRERIWISGECTFCNPERFHSYRYHGDTAGRQGGFIGVSSC